MNHLFADADQVIVLILVLSFSSQSSLYILWLCMLNKYLLYQKQREKRTLIMKTFQEAIYEDRRNINLIGFTRLGMFELTRRRRGKSLNQKLFKPLENLKSPLTLALDALYQVKREMRINPGKLFLIHTPQEVTEALCSGPALEAKLLLEKEMCGPIEVKTNSGQAFPEVSIITDIGRH